MSITLVRNAKPSKKRDLPAAQGRQGRKEGGVNNCKSEVRCPQPLLTSNF